MKRTDSSWYLLLPSILFIAFTIGGCRSNTATSAFPQSQKVPPSTLASATPTGMKQTPPPSEIYYPSDILARSQTIAGQTIRIHGIYKGWKGSCTGKPPRTRSDWMLEDNTNCIYVTGGTPPGMKPSPGSASIGKKISFYGKIQADSDGRIYIEYMDFE